LVERNATAALDNVICGTTKQRCQREDCGQCAI
jgi:hypothetical protein